MKTYFELDTTKPIIKESDMEECLTSKTSNFENPLETMTPSDKEINKVLEDKIKKQEDAKNNYSCYFSANLIPNVGIKMGIYIRNDNGQEFRKTYNEDNKHQTINSAHYKALITVFKLMHDKINSNINIYGNSKMVIMQINGLWKMKKGQYIDYAIEAHKLLEELKLKNNITINWVHWKNNQEAYKLTL